MGYNYVADNMGLSSFVYLLLPPKYEKCAEIPIEFDLTAVQGHVSTAIKHPVSDRVKPSFIIFDIWAL